MSVLDETFGAADEDLADADDAGAHSVALQRMQHLLRTRMRAHEQRQGECSAAPGRVPDGEFLRFRRGLIEWLCDSVDRLSLHRSTFHTASNLLDRTLTQTSLSREGRLGLVSAACVRIAAKHCEAESAVPFLASLAAECGGRYSEYEIAQMEITVLTQLAWAIHCNTAYDFVGALGLSTLIRAGDVIGGVSIGRLDGWTQYCAEVDQLIRRYADFFVDLSVYEYPHGSQPDSLLAAAAVAAARTLFGVTPTWPECMRRDGGYALPELRATLCHLLRTFMTDFSEDWERLQEMASGIVPDAPVLYAALKEHGAGRQSAVPSPTSIVDLFAGGHSHAG